VVSFEKREAGEALRAAPLFVIDSLLLAHAFLAAENRFVLFQDQS
jgi:hypothetical protein